VYPYVNDLILDATNMTANTSKLIYEILFFRNRKSKEMKKIFILFILLLSGIIANGEDGDGTSSNPYYGTISTPVTWDPDDYTNGEIYVGTSTHNDLTISTGGYLIILPGATIIFTQTTSDLIITGTGQLDATGTISNIITFTADDGETGGRWGHIRFDNMSGTNASSIEFCIIEYGRKDGSLGTPESVGGGLYANYDYVSISNNIFRNNYALFGGGVFIGAGKSPGISNCLFIDNTAREAGGGIYLYNGSASSIENCIFDGNYADGTLASYYSGGGVQFGVSITNAQVINSTFVGNTSDNTGDSFFTLSGGTLTNCILWGSDDQCGFHSSGGTVEYCAIQGYSSSSHYSNCFELNSSNDATDGPNFYDPDDSDWSIIFISPCRDSGTGTGAPTTDINGDNRIGSVDIGAYEVQYSLWDGSEGTSWSTSDNWEQGVNPGSSGSDVVIPSGLSDYPTSTGTDFTISSDNHLILEPGAQLTLGTLTNSGTLRLESDESDIFSLMVNSYTNNSGAGTEEIELYVTGGGTSYNWHYISSPVANLSTDIFTGTTLNLVGYFEERPQASDMEGWVAFDGYVYDDGSDDDTYSFSTLNVGEGYNLYCSAAHTFSFPGTLNAGDKSIPLSYTTTYEGTWNGLNLVGNPYTCSIDWDVIDEGLDEGVSHAIYFFRASDNIIVSWVNGVGYDEDVTSIIPPMQGFFIKTSASSTSIDLIASSDRLHGTQPRYKSGSLIPLIRMEFTDGEQPDRAVIRFDDQASNDFDDNFDAAKFLISESRNLLWSELNDKKFSINAVPFPEEEVTIKMVINVPEQGQYSLKATSIAGLDNYDIILTDMAQDNYKVDLKQTSEYTFSAEKGRIEDRFTITIGDFATGFEDIEEDKSFNIYTYANQLNIQNMSEQWNNALVDINIYDLTGRLISKHKDNEIYKGETIQLPFNRPTGIYLIEITDGTRRMVKKLSHR